MKEIFAKRLLELMREEHLSQRKLAKAANLPQTVISNWINQISLPTIDHLCKLADFFQVSTDYLLGRKEY